MASSRFEEEVMPNKYGSWEQHEAEEEARICSLENPGKEYVVYQNPYIMSDGGIDENWCFAIPEFAGLLCSCSFLNGKKL
jgi:hypothetical protein